jgi:uncharacterized membrane protein YoaK (UPF0700 family)
MGLNPVFGEWYRFASNLCLFFGFVFGCGFAIMTQNLMKSKTTQFFFNWGLFALPAALYPFYGPHVSTQVAFLMMGLSAGFGVGFFRRIFHLDQINNAMATGSVRFVGVYFAEVFLKKNKKETLTLIIFVLCVLFFALGASLFGIAFLIDNAGTFNFSVINAKLLGICVIPMFFAPKNVAA